MKGTELKRNLPRWMTEYTPQERVRLYKERQKQIREISNTEFLANLPRHELQVFIDVLETIKNLDKRLLQTRLGVLGVGSVAMPANLRLTDLNDIDVRIINSEQSKQNKKEVGEIISYQLQDGFSRIGLDFQVENYTEAHRLHILKCKGKYGLLRSDALYFIDYNNTDTAIKVQGSRVPIHISIASEGSLPLDDYIKQEQSILVGDYPYTILYLG